MVVTDLKQTIRQPEILKHFPDLFPLCTFLSSTEDWDLFLRNAERVGAGTQYRKSFG